MPKKAYLASHYSSDELKKNYIKSKDSVELRRWHLLWKVSIGWTIKKSAIAVGISYDYAKEIVKKYNELGVKAVKNSRNQHREHKGGKKSILTEEQMKKLMKDLESTSPDGGIWTGPKVARWIENETGVEKVWNQRGWDYLKKCNYSWQNPRPKHKKADKLKQEEFQINFPLKINKLEVENPEFEIDVWFFDEHRVGLKPILRKVWSKIGERPIASVNHRYEWLYIYGFVKPKTGESLWYLIARVNTKWLNLVYKAFAIDAEISQKKSLVSTR